MCNNFATFLSENATILNWQSWASLEHQFPHNNDTRSPSFTLLIFPALLLPCSKFCQVFLCPPWYWMMQLIWFHTAKTPLSNSDNLITDSYSMCVHALVCARLCVCVLVRFNQKKIYMLPWLIFTVFIATSISDFLAVDRRMPRWTQPKCPKSWEKKKHQPQYECTL